MPANWQQWYPHNIDAWQSSSRIQDLSDAGYRAVHNLIQRQYQSEDGMLPASEKELARLSRARDNWRSIRKEVLACFEKNENGRLYSQRQYEEWQHANSAYKNRAGGAKKTNERRKTVTEQSPHGHRTIRKRSPAHIDTNNTSTSTETKTEQEEPPGAPAPDPEAIPSLVNEIVRAHPKSRLRKLQPREVTQAHETAVLDAMADEIGPAVTDVQALAMILDRTEMLADSVPRTQWRFFKDVVEFYRNHDYRMDPEDFAQHKGASNGRVVGNGRPANNIAPAKERVRSGADAARAAARASAEAPDWGTTGQHGGRVSTPGHDGINADVPARAGEPGGGIRDGPIAASSRIVTDAPEILSPSQRNPRGA